MTSPARPLVESALLAALGALFILVTFYIPVLGTFATLVSPLPIAFAVIRHGPRWGVLSSIATLLVLLPILNPVYAVAFWVVFGTMGLALGYSVRRNFPAERTIGLMMGASIVGMAADLLATYIATGLTLRDLVEESIKAFTGAYEMSAKILGENPMLEEAIKAMTPDFVMKVAPGSFFVSALFLAWLNYEVARRILPRFGYSAGPLRPFSRWIMPVITGHLWILAYMGLYLQPAYADKLPFLAVMAQNVFLAAGMILLLDAASVLCFFLMRAGFTAGMAGVFTALAVSMAYTNPLFLWLAQIFGMIDVLFDLRKVRYPEIAGL